MIKGVLLDIDGVLYVGSKPVKGATECLQWLDGRQIPYRFVTNTSTRSREQIAAKLGSFGIEARAEQIFSAPAAAISLLHREGWRRIYTLIDPALECDFAGFERDSKSPQAVVMGDIGDRWTYRLLNQVFSLMMQGVPLVAMHRNRYWRTDAGIQMDIGAFVAGLEYVTGAKALVAGKPEPTFFQLALADIQVTAESALMVGDDVESDVGGGQAVGIRGVLVRTGKFTERGLEQSQIQPDWVIDSVADLPGLLEQI